MAKIIDTTQELPLDEVVKVEMTYHELLHIYAALGNSIPEVMAETFSDFSGAVEHSTHSVLSLHDLFYDELTRRGFNV